MSARCLNGQVQDNSPKLTKGHEVGRLCGAKSKQTFEARAC